VRPWSLLLVLLVALPLVVGVVNLPPHDAPEAPIHTGVGARYLERGVEETGYKNLVTAVLLNYRGFDTFFEVVVIFTALVAVLALPRGSAARPGGAPAPAADQPHDAPSGAAGVPVSPVVSYVVRLMAPFMAMFALAMVYRGHVTPGGGFQAAAVFAAIFIAIGLVLGRARAARLVPVDWRPWLQGAAPLAFALIAWVGWRLTGAFLGFPTDDHAAQEAMGLVLEFAIALGGGVILARLFLEMET
jgi:multicomponent Na+:H+ antiporter subunit B